MKALGCDTYVRCRFCDSAGSTDQYELFELPKVEGICHDLVSFVCPACGTSGSSFIFREPAPQDNKEPSYG